MLAFVICAQNQAFSQRQTKLITGIVIGEDNAPIEGAMVRIKGTNRHSGSQSDGIYYIEVNPGDTALVFTHTGYNAGEVKLTGDAEYSIRLTKAVPLPPKQPVATKSVPRKKITAFRP